MKKAPYILCLSLIACAGSPTGSDVPSVSKPAARTDWSSIQKTDDLPEHAPQVLLIRPKAGKTLRGSPRVAQILEARAEPAAMERADQAVTGAAEELTLMAGVDLLETLQTLQKEADVDLVQPNFVYRLSTTPNDPFYRSEGTWDENVGDQWGLSSIDAAGAWGLSLGGDAVIAVLDSGLDVAHRDAPRLWEGTNGIHGHDCVAGLTETIDTMGHGTHVAGIAAAKGNNGRGIMGVAPRARVMSVRVTSGAATPSTHTTRMVCGLDFVAAHGADVVNMSLGIELNGANDTLLHEAIQRVYAKDIPIVAASGNDGSDGADDGSPSKYPEVFSVGSISSNGERSYFSNYGSALDFMAPGHRVGSLMSSEYSLFIPEEDVTQDLPNETYAALSGTSMATPHVAGIVALLKSMKKNLTPAEIYNLLRDSAHDMGDVGKDDLTGYGLVDAGQALRDLDAQLPDLNLEAKDAKLAVGEKGVVELKLAAAQPGDVSVQVLDLPEGAAYDKKTRSIRWTPAKATLGKTYAVVVRAADSVRTVEKYVYLSVVEKGEDGEGKDGGCRASDPAPLLLGFALTLAAVRRRGINRGSC